LFSNSFSDKGSENINHLFWRQQSRDNVLLEAKPDKFSVIDRIHAFLQGKVDILLLLGSIKLEEIGQTVFI
jgi:hypothetical protein